MTKFHRTALLLSAISLSAISQNTAFAANQSIGVNSAVKGNVTIQSGEQEAKQAVIKKPVLLGDVVNSNRVGSLQVLLKDQTIFTVGPDCNLTIDKFVYDPSKDTNSMSASVKKGMFRFMSGNISNSGPDSVSIETPIASMGIRGTMAEGLIGEEAIKMARNAGIISPTTKVDLKNASLFVLRGPGKKNRSKNRRGEISIESGGEMIVVKEPGFAVFVSAKNTPPSAPFMLSENDAKIFHDKLRTEPTGGQSYKPFDINFGAVTNPDSTGPNRGVDFFNPRNDLQWPSDADVIHPDLVPEPGFCSPQNPDYPNC